MRRFLDQIYFAAGGLAAVMVAAIVVLMIGQSGLRAFGVGQPDSLRRADHRHRLGAGGRLDHRHRMFILAGAAFLTKTMAFAGIPRALAEWVTAMQLSPMALIAALTVVYLVLGAALDGISMIVLISAVVLPMVQKAGFDLVWCGNFIVLLVEIAEVTPPVGFNLFVLQNMTGKDSNVIARAAIPFFICMVICIALITLFPQIVTILPDLVMGKEK